MINIFIEFNDSLVNIDSILTIYKEESHWSNPSGKHCSCYSVTINRGEKMLELQKDFSKEEERDELYNELKEILLERK